MQRPFKFTKLKLITGYILILLLGAIAIVFIYKQTIALTQKGNDEIVMQQKLFIISNTLTKLYEAENTGIAFSQTGTQKNFDTYMKLIEDIKDNMDTLKNLSISSKPANRHDKYAFRQTDQKSERLVLRQKILYTRRLLQQNNRKNRYAQRFGRYHPRSPGKNYYSH